MKWSETLQKQLYRALVLDVSYVTTENKKMYVHGGRITVNRSHVIKYVQSRQEEALSFSAAPRGILGCYQHRNPVSDTDARGSCVALLEIELLYSQTDSRR